MIKSLCQVYPVQLCSFLFCHLHYLYLGRQFDTDRLYGLTRPWWKPLTFQFKVFFICLVAVHFRFLSGQKEKKTQLKSMWIIVLNSSILSDLYSYDHNSLVISIPYECIVHLSLAKQSTIKIKENPFQLLHNIILNR